MSEAGRVSVAVEVTGLEKATSDLGKLDTAGAKASASVGRSMAALEKQMAAIDAIVTKATSGIVAAIDRQSAAMTKGFAGIDAAMRRMQTGTAAAAASVSADAGKAGASLTQLDAIADRVAAGVTAALAGIAPAAASAATGTQQATTAMAGFDAAAQTIVAASARMEAALQEATGATRALSDSFAKAPKSDPFKPQSDGAENLRAKFNPLFAIGETYRTQVAAIRQANADGAIGFHEMEMAIQRAGAVADAQQRQYVKMDAALGATGDAARLTSNQMLNLSRQGNDVITMFAMGAPPMQIFASQAGQIYGALEEGPRGLRGSLEAIKGAVMGFAAGLGPAGIALGALGAAAVTFGIATRRNVEPIEDVIKRQSDAVRQLRDAYGLAGDAAESYVRRSPRAVRLGLADDNAATIQRAQDEIRARLSEQYSGGSEGRRYRDFRTPAYRELVIAFEALRKSAADGVPDFRRFEETLASIPDIDLAGHAGEVIAQNRSWAAGLVPLQNEIAEMNGLLDGSVAAAERYNSALDNINERIPDLRTNAEQINAALASALSNAGEDQGAGLVARFRAEKAMAADTATALDIYTHARADLAAVGLGDDARAIAEINAQYDALEDQYLGNADALNVLVDARRAAVEAVNAQSAFDAGEKARQEAEEYAKALADQARGINEQVATLQRQVELYGQSEGATAAVEARTRMLAEAYALARENNQVVTPEQIAQIEQAAASVGSLTDQLVAMREAEAQAKRVAETIADLDFQNSLFGMSEADREIGTTLRQLQVSYESMDGQRIAGAVRYRAEQERVQEQLETQNQFVENVLSTSLDALFDIGSAESWGEAVMGIFADIGRQFQELAKQNLMQALFGQNYTTGQLAPGQRSIAQPGFPAGFGSVPIAANQNVPAGGALNIGAVQALNTNLQRSSRSALDVARQFDGLNERADSAVLDSFMQASGNWRNLSAADTAWCAAFANAAITEAGGRGTGSNLASSFMNWGQGTNAPQVGDIVVLKPQSAGASGHVGFVAGFGDGKVQVFGGNQSNAANTRSFGLDQVRGYRTGVGVGGAGIGGSFAMPQMAAPVYAPQMSGAAQQAMAQGWSGFGPVPGQAGRTTVGMLGQGGRLQQFMQSPIGQLGMQGIGAFGAGYSSGSTGGGALQGGLGAFLSSGFNPVAGVVGLVGGALGGLFGGRKKREQEHQQKAQAWDQMAPQFAEYQRMLREDTGPSSGLRSAYGAIDAQMEQFVGVGSAAWKRGSNNSSALFDQVSQSRVGYQQRTNEAFQRRYWGTLDSLENGRGMAGPFVEAQDAITELGKTLSTFVDDTRLVFGDGSVEAQRAAEASISQLRAMLTGGRELTEVGEAVQRMEGAAAALRYELTQLGVSAEDAGSAVSADLASAMGQLRGDFAQGIQDQLWSLDGKSYIAEFRQFFTDIDGAIQDALLVGADRGLVDELFVKQAQSMVDGAQLSGEAFDELILAMPRLSGVVREFSAAAEEAAKRTADQIAALRLSYDDRVFETTIDTSTEAGSLARFDRYAAREREEEIKAGGDAILDLERALAAERGQIVKQFADRAAEETKRALESAQSFLGGFTRNIGSYLDGLRAGPDSPLTGQARVDEARKQFEEQLGLARGGDRDALGSITNYADRLLEADRAYNTSSPAAQATFDEVTRALEGLPKQLKAEDIVAAEIAKAAKDLQETIRQATLDLAARISTDFATFDANFDGFLTIDELRPHFAGTELELRRIFTEIDLNGDGQLSRLEGLLASDGLTRSTLQSAFLLGPNATAGALAPHFDRLDTSLDGLLDFDEMKVALGGIATDAQIRSLMAEMDLNGDLQISRLEMLLASDGVTRSALTSALSAGPDATARLTASALANHFTMLDTSLNGLLDFNEMKAALGGVATDVQIREMMTVLDANGDGQISHLELLNARANAQVGSLNDLQALTRLTWDASRVSQTYQERTRHFTEVNSQLLQSIATTLANSLSMQERIRANLAEDNGSRGLRQFAMGGISSVPAIFGEAGPEAAVPLPDGRTIPVTLSMPPMPRLREVNVGGVNDNAGSALLTEVKALREEVRQLREENNAVTVQAAERVARPVEKMTGATEKGVRETRRARRTSNG